MAFTHARVEAINPLTPTILELTLVPASGQSFPPFRAGQYAIISFPGRAAIKGGRPFSMSRSAADPSRLTFGIRTQGRFTKALREVVVGETATVAGPYGTFTTDPAHEPHLVFLAGGIGITPFMSIIETAAAEHWPNDVTLIASHRSAVETPYVDDLKAAQRVNPNFRFVNAVADGRVPTEATGFASGRITPELLASMLPLEPWAYHYYLCGPGPFMKAMRAMLLASNVRPTSIRIEEFAVAPSTIFEHGTTTPKIVFAGWVAAAAVAFGAIYQIEQARRAEPVATLYDPVQVNTIRNTVGAYVPPTKTITTNVTTNVPVTTTPVANTNRSTVPKNTNTTKKVVTPPVATPIVPRTRLS